MVFVVYVVVDIVYAVVFYIIIVDVVAYVIVIYIVVVLVCFLGADFIIGTSLLASFGTIFVAELT